MAIEIAVSAYWAKREQELGEKVLFKSIAQGQLSNLKIKDRVPDIIGILFLTKSYLLFEYSHGSRKTILDLLFSRKERETITDTVTVIRKDIKNCRVLPAIYAQQWIKKGKNPLEIQKEIENREYSIFSNLLFGTRLVVCTDELFLSLATPMNSRWERELSLPA
jgi:hypothetical protein